MIDTPDPQQVTEARSQLRAKYEAVRAEPPDLEYTVTPERLTDAAHDAEIWREAARMLRDGAAISGKHGGRALRGFADVFERKAEKLTQATHE